MPTEKKSDRVKKAVESKAAPKQSAPKATKSSSTSGRKTAVPAPSPKPAPKRTRAKKTPAAIDASDAERPQDSTQSDNHATDPISHEHISVRAYYLSEELRACGEQWDSEKIWLEAERQIRAERK